MAKTSPPASRPGRCCPSNALIAFLASLYCLYLLYGGLVMVMKPSADKAEPYVAVLIIATIVMAVAIIVVTSLAMPGPVRGF